MLVFSLFFFHHHIVPKGISSACGTLEHALCILVFFLLMRPPYSASSHCHSANPTMRTPFPMELLGGESIAMSFKQSYYIPLAGPHLCVPSSVKTSLYEIISFHSASSANFQFFFLQLSYCSFSFCIATTLSRLVAALIWHIESSKPAGLEVAADR